MGEGKLHDRGGARTAIGVVYSGGFCHLGGDSSQGAGRSGRSCSAGGVCIASRLFASGGGRHPRPSTGFDGLGDCNKKCRRSERPRHNTYKQTNSSTIATQARNHPAVGPQLIDALPEAPALPQAAFEQEPKKEFVGLGEAPA